MRQGKQLLGALAENYGNMVIVRLLPRALAMRVPDVDHPLLSLACPGAPDDTRPFGVAVAGRAATATNLSSNPEPGARADDEPDPRRSAGDVSMHAIHGWGRALRLSTQTQGWSYERSTARLTAHSRHQSFCSDSQNARVKSVCDPDVSTTWSNSPTCTQHGDLDEL